MFAERRDCGEVDGARVAMEALADDSASTAAGDRESRKRAEKRRRTVLNSLVGELAGLLPLVSESSRKIDKTGVLRLAAHEIRKEHVFGDSVAAARARDPGFGYDAAQAFLELVDGFLLTVNARGIVVVASPNVQRYLGHAQIDLLGRSLAELAHPEDAARLAEELRGRAGERRDVVVRLARAARHEEGRDSAGGREWATCRLRGAFRRSDRADDDRAGAPRRQRARRDRLLAPRDNDLVLIALGHVLPPLTVCARLVEPNREEYWTRHLVDGRLVHCDQRISLVAGYLSEEVTGVSGFTFMHKEDVRWVIIALRQMYDQSQPYGESCYRLVSRTGRFMYMRTRGYLEVDRATKEAQSFVCINSLVSDEDGARLIADMKKRYSAIVELDESDERLKRRGDDGGLEDPRQLERVIMHLIADLPSPAGSSASASASSSPGPSSCSSCSSSSPSPSVLTIVPPNPSMVKLSIEKSISVVNSSGALKRMAPPPPPPPSPVRKRASAGD